MAEGRSLLSCCLHMAGGERRGGVPTLPSCRDGLRIFCGITISMAVITGMAMNAAVPVLVASLGASACLVFVVPNGPYSRPRNVVGGHFVAAGVGVLVAGTLGCTWYGAAIAVGGAVVAMLYTRTLHPPAAATALIAVLANQGLLYPLVPAAAGAAILMAAGMVFNRLFASTAGHPGPPMADRSGSPAP